MPDGSSLASHNVTQRDLYMSGSFQAWVYDLSPNSFVLGSWFCSFYRAAKKSQSLASQNTLWVGKTSLYLILAQA